MIQSQVMPLLTLQLTSWAANTAVAADIAVSHLLWIYT